MSTRIRTARWSRACHLLARHTRFLRHLAGREGLKFKGPAFQDIFEAARPEFDV